MGKKAIIWMYVFCVINPYSITQLKVLMLLMWILYFCIVAALPQTTITEKHTRLPTKLCRNEGILIIYKLVISPVQ